MGSLLGVQKVAARRLGIGVNAYLEKIEAGLKWCTGCKSWKPVEAFGQDSTRGDGRDASCFECRRVETPRTTKGRVSTFKGRHHTQDVKDAISAKNKGKQGPRKGQHRTLEERQKMSLGHRTGGRTCRGAAHHAYKDGKAVVRRGIRFSIEYKRWRFDVFMRDGFRCQRCGDDRGGNLHAHHIKPFADFPELRFEVTNGVTLCVSCHKKEHQR